jgi:HAD superfamily hydrolase (TIGR01509 family)
METLVTEPFLEVMPGFFGMTRDELLAVKHPTSWIEFELGQIAEVEYFERFFRDGRRIDGAGLRRCIQKAYQWIDGMESVLADLKSAGYEMHALSNYPVWYKMIEESLRVSRYLEWSFVSCRTGVRKPDPGAYLGAAEALGVAPSRCLFVDDRKVNVDAARRLGMQAIRFTGAQALRRDLAELNVL